MRHYIVYREFDKEGRFWRSTYHRAPATLEETEAWLADHGYTEGAESGLWKSLEQPATNIALVCEWEALPDNIQKLMVAMGLGPNT